MRDDLQRLAPALLASLLVHALLLSLTFAGHGIGLPGFGLPWLDRRTEVPDLRVVLRPAAANEIARTSSAPAPPRPQAERVGVAMRDVPGPRAPSRSAGEAAATRAEPKKDDVSDATPRPLPIEPANDRGAPVVPLVPAEPQRPVVAAASAASTASAPAPIPPAADDAAIRPTGRERPARSADVLTSDASESELPREIDHGQTESTRDADRREAARAEEAARIDSERREAERQEAARQQAAREEAARAEAERAEAQRREAAQREAERREAERIEAERREAERQEAARLQAAREEAARAETERAEAQRREAAQREEERREAERIEAERREAERQEAERREAALREAARIDSERREAERREAARREAIRQEAERIERERRQAEQLELERQQAARAEAARAEAERAEAARRSAAQEAAREAARREEEAQREARLRAIGRQLDAEADRRMAASTARRARVWGRADPNVELIRYAEAWERKIQLNTPTETVRDLARRIRTQPIVTVAVRSDGSVESVSFVVSSGVAEVDEAIRRIVHGHEHYPAFSPTLASEFDVVEIRRTWHFDDAIRLY